MSGKRAKKMNVTGAKICDELPYPETRDIVLPNQTECVSQIAVDIGGSLAKVVYFSKRPNTTKGGSLNFIKFETDKIDECIDFISSLVAARRNPDASDLKKKIVIKATGGGAHKFYDSFTKKLKEVKVEKEDEMECLIIGLNFLISEIPYEVFTYSEHDPMCFEGTPTPANMFPYMLVNIGSGVSILKVTDSDKFDRISGTSLGGGTLWGLLSLLTGAKSFDEMLELSKNGDNTNVDMLVGDIYGSDYNKIGLKSTTIASSMGKVFKKNVKQDVGNFRSEDISKSLLYMVSNNIGQIAYLNAKAHGLKRIYFGGCFIRGHPITMNTLSYAINFWSQGTIKALFLRHEGYLGAVGAFLKNKKQRSYSFSEIFTKPQMITEDSINAYGTLESTSTKLVAFPKLKNLDDYHPDTLQLTDPTAQRHWIDALEKNLHNLVELAVEWSSNGEYGEQYKEDVKRRASSFDTLFRSHLAMLRNQPNMYGALTVRSLLDLREQCLHELGFPDIFAKVKTEENKLALLNLQEILNKVDSIQSVEDKIELLIENVLAGNMFDWGSSQVLEMLRKGELSFETAKAKVTRPDHLNNTRSFIERITSKDKPPFKKAVIFVDNSGADIILGIIPFARFLISLGMDIILAANSFPAVNDITFEELSVVVTSIAEIDHLIAAAWTSKKLSVIGTGSASPCLDLRRINDDLAEECKDVDLVVLEGMGRAIHTNYNVKFTCESLKIAVFKNAITAMELGAHMYDAIVSYEGNN
ncbi:6864_t:CDS:10 [Funneliformis mosseae]|uniref:6864_t:CDS:1 n=1 Tax=Funneliformis mosseae TaxID=27381 RepID=A0A9N8WAV4_FUNMO|nr:6864_t:CDS:10 [Funneliformis mosseae]